MPENERNVFNSNGWTLQKVADFTKLCDFDCGKADLNDFFRNDCHIQKRELLNQTFTLIEAGVEDFFPLALISLSNDAVKKNKVGWWLGFKDQKKVYPFYPAVKIGRLGVRKELRRQELGTHLMNMIKTMFITDNRTGCRFLTVDAYNEDDVLPYYLKNDFQFFSNKDENKRTRAMFFDLKRLRI